MRNVNCLADIFRCEDAAISGSVATIFEGHASSYGELDKASNRCANAFIRAGVKPNDRIAVMDKNSDEFSALFGGALKARATLVPVNFRLSAQELEFILSDSGASILFIGAQFTEIAYAIKRKLPGLAIVFLQGISPKAGEPEIPSLALWADGAPDSDPRLPNTPQDHAVQLYTSGTTGHPKGVYHSDAHYMAGMAALGRATAFIGQNEVQLICMPLCHIAGLINLLNGLLAGCCQVITREFDPADVLALIDKYQVNTTLFAPVMIQVLVNMPQAKNTNFTSLNRIFYGSAPIAQTVLEKAQDSFGCDFWQLYGMTENIGMATFLAPADHDPARNKLLSCGRPYPDSELKIVDQEGNEQAAGEVGEIVTRAQWTMPGYWNRPEATEEALLDGWLHTGDAGYFDEEGYLYIHDRLKDMIVSGGENIYPAEVENTLFAHSHIAEAAVFGVPDEKWGESVMAAVVLKPGQLLSEQDIIVFVKERIASFKVPKRITFISELPRNTAGKVLKRELRAPYWEGRNRSVG